MQSNRWFHPRSKKFEWKKKNCHDISGCVLFFGACKRLSVRNQNLLLSRCWAFQSESYKLDLTHDRCVYVHRVLRWKRFQKPNSSHSCCCSGPESLLCRFRFLCWVITPEPCFWCGIIIIGKSFVCCCCYCSHWVDSAWTGANNSHNASSGQLISLRFVYCKF